MILILLGNTFAAIIKFDYMLRILLIGLLLVLFTKAEVSEYKKSINNGKIIGTVIDSVSNSQLTMLQLLCFSHGSKKVLNGTITDSAGNLLCLILKMALIKLPLNLSVSFPGHFNNVVVNENNPLIDFKNIVLTLKSTDLAECYHNCNSTINRKQN